MYSSKRFLYMAIVAVAVIFICLQLVSIQLKMDAAKQQVPDLFKSLFATIASSVGPPKPKVDVPHYHENLHPSNLQLINITDFNIIINTDICNVTDIAIVTIIHSAGSNRAARDVIRTTWGNPDIPGVHTRLVFLLGNPQDEEKQKELLHESQSFGDLIEGDFVDSYHNLSYKNVFGKMWVSQFCDQAEFVVKTDDDMYVDLYAVYAITRPYLQHKYYKENSFILCPVLNGLPILRNPNSKWFASYDDLPRDEARFPGNTTEVYPTDCTGWIYIVNPGTAGRIVEMAKHAIKQKFFWIDDVWVTGFLAGDLNITHLNMNEFWTMKSERLLLGKSAQNPDVYHRDFISAPQNRDYKLSLALHRRARWCYLNRCWSNIYCKDRKLTEDDKINEEMLLHYFLKDNP